MIKKYKWKCRILIVKTPDYTSSKYRLAKELYQKNIKDFHKRFIKLVSKKVNTNFSIELLGFDGEKKRIFKTFNTKKILKITDQMPMSKVFKNKNKKPLNLSLFSDYNPKTTTQGLGFKDKAKAVYTLNKIKNRDQKYQINVVSTMLGRAKKHPSQTKGMREAILVFNKWINNYKKKNKK